MGKFAYVNQCIKNNDVPEYIIIDNPFFGNDEEIDLDQSILKKTQKMNTSVYSNEMPSLDDSRMGMFTFAQVHKDTHTAGIFKKQLSKPIEEVPFGAAPKSEKNTAGTGTGTGTVGKSENKSALPITVPPQNQSTITSTSNSNSTEIKSGAIFHQAMNKINERITGITGITGLSGVNTKTNIKAESETINKIFNIASFIPQENKQQVEIVRASNLGRGRISMTPQKDIFESKKKYDFLHEFMNQITETINKRIITSLEEEKKIKGKIKIYI
jgi:hypothetical protein